VHKNQILNYWINKQLFTTVYYNLLQFTVQLLRNCYENGKNMASIIKVGGKWRAQIRRTGHSTITQTFDTKTKASAWAVKTEYEQIHGLYKDGRGLSQVTLGELIERYTLEIGKVKPFGRSKKSSLGMLTRHIGGVSMAALTSQRIVKFAQVRQAQGAGGVTVGMELTYLTGILKVARALWRMPVSGEVVLDAREILRYMGVVTKSKQRDRRPTQSELDTLYAYFAALPNSKIPYVDILKFAIGTALRSGEIAGLLWADLNQVDKTILIRNRKDPKEKLGNDQTVPLLNIGGIDAFAIAKRQPKTSITIFNIKAHSLSSTFPRACKACGIVDLHFHDLRHEGVSRLFEAGYPIEQVALVSGHKDWAMLKRYTQIKAVNLHRT
jgi:integrase